MQVPLESIFKKFSQLLIIFTFLVTLAHPYLDSETFEGVPVGFLHEPHPGDVLLNTWDVSCGHTEDKGLPSLLEDRWLPDARDFNSELSSIFVLGVLPLWIDTSLEHHDCSHLVQAVLALLEPVFA